ncbi:MAG TPA: hypothetical protein VE690_22295 [Rhodopila sp.]|nr:hypothetical protein [Rhodopila sp.]
MPAAVTINRPDVVALIEEASRLTGGNKTEAVAMALGALLAREACKGSVFGAHRGSVVMQDGLDPIAPVLIAPVFEDEMDAETSRELEHDRRRLDSSAA